MVSVVNAKISKPYQTNCTKQFVRPCIYLKNLKETISCFMSIVRLRMYCKLMVSKGYFSPISKHPISKNMPNLPSYPYHLPSTFMIPSQNTLVESRLKLGWNILFYIATTHFWRYPPSMAKMSYIFLPAIFQDPTTPSPLLRSEK